MGLSTSAATDCWRAQPTGVAGRFRSAVCGHLIWQRALAGDTDRSRQLIKCFPVYCRGLLGYAPWATLFSVVSFKYIRGFPFSIVPSLSLSLSSYLYLCLPFSLSHLAASFHHSRYLSTRLRASVPHDRHDVPGVSLRKGKARPRFEWTCIN